MSDAIRIYAPEGQMEVAKRLADNSLFGFTAAKFSKPVHRNAWKKKTNMELLQETINEREERIQALYAKFQWADILRNWIIAILMVLLTAGFVNWALNIHVERRAAALNATAMAEYDAQYEAIRQSEMDAKRAEENSIQRQMEHNAAVKAKIGYGSRNFIEKYHYSDADFITLYQCIDNRLNNPNYPDTIDEIASMEGQWVGYYESNQVQDYYYKLAMKTEQTKQNQVSSPVDVNKVYTVYTPHGIYLTDDPKSPEYTWWRYSE